MTTSRLSISVPLTLNKDIMDYLAKKSQDGKLRGLKKIFYIQAIMEKLEKEKALNPETKKECLKEIQENGEKQ